MKEKNKNKNEIKFVTHLKDIPIPSEMPSPPDYLLKKIQNDLTWEETQNALDQWSVGQQNLPEVITGAISEPAEIMSDKIQEFSPSPSPRMVDYMTYQHAVEERVSAETGYAEIYSKYLELVSFNEKILRTVRRYQNFKKRIRMIYDRALKGDEVLRSNVKLMQRNLVATEKALSDLQIENESLRISLTSHEEAYKGALAQLGIQQAETSNIQGQFRSLADEFENRGILLDEADRKIRGYLTQIEQMGSSLRELREKYDFVREESLLLQNKSREIEIREAGINTLNEELAHAVTKSQRQIRELEDKLKYQNENAAQRILALEQEVDRLRENRRAENLVEQSRRMQKTGETPQQTKPELAKRAPVLTPASETTRKQWDDFYHRWSHIIDGLTSHSVPIDRPLNLKKEDSTTQLMSEVGDLEIL